MKPPAVDALPNGLRLQPKFSGGPIVGVVGKDDDGTNTCISTTSSLTWEKLSRDGTTSVGGSPSFKEVK